MELVWSLAQEHCFMCFTEDACDYSSSYSRNIVAITEIDSMLILGRHEDDLWLNHCNEFQYLFQYINCLIKGFMLFLVSKDHVHNNLTNSSTVRPESRIIARNVPLVISLWFGTVILRCGGSFLLKIIWLPVWWSN